MRISPVFLAAVAACGLMFPSMVETVQAQAQAGYYALDQATAGAEVYQKRCASCHGAEMEGYIGPSLKGHAFQVITTRQAMHVDKLLLIVSRSEPQDNPGSLSDEEDSDVVAYLLQQNGYPSGREKLSAQSPRLRDLDLSR